MLVMESKDEERERILWLVLHDQSKLLSSEGRECKRIYQKLTGWKRREDAVTIINQMKKEWERQSTTFDDAHNVLL